MPLKTTRNKIALSGYSSLDEAEPLKNWLCANPRGTIDLTDCTNAHTAVFQLLMLRAESIRKPPKDADFAKFIALVTPCPRS